MTSRRRIAATALSWGLTAPLRASPLRAAPRQDGDGAGTEPLVTSAWSRAALKGSTGAVYLTVRGGSQSDRLIGARCDVSAGPEMHFSSQEHGVTTMRSVPAIDVRAGQIVRFAPGGLHIMLPDLQTDLRPGQTLSLTLVFSRAGEVRVPVVVRRAGAPAAESDMMPMDPPQHR